MVAQLDFTTQKKQDNLVEIVNAFQEAAKADKNAFSLPQKEPQGYAHSLFQYPAMMVPEVQKADYPTNKTKRLQYKGSTRPLCRCGDKYHGINEMRS